MGASPPKVPVQVPFVNLSSSGEVSARTPSAGATAVGAGTSHHGAAGDTEQPLPPSSQAAGSAEVAVPVPEAVAEQVPPPNTVAEQVPPPADPPSAAGTEVLEAEEPPAAEAPAEVDSPASTTEWEIRPVQQTERGEAPAEEAEPPAEKVVPPAEEAVPPVEEPAVAAPQGEPSTPVGLAALPYTLNSLEG